MTRKEIFVIVSSEASSIHEFIRWLICISIDRRVVVCIDDEGQTKKEIDTNSKEYWAVREALSDKKKKLEKSVLGSNVAVEIPMFNMGKCYRLVSGDDYFRIAYRSFGELYVVDLQNRFEQKIMQFGHLPKVIEVIGF